jgi:hypothetical protein
VLSTRRQFWYFGQAFALADSVKLGLALGTGFGLWNLMASLLDPQAEDTPLALLKFYGPMFTAWGLAGFVSSGRTGRILSGIRVGTTVAFITFVVFTLAVISRVNLFLDVTSQRPDWENLVAAFQASGFESLRTYANYVYLTGAPFKIMVASLIGAVSGLVGGLFGIWARHQLRPPLEP